MEIHQLVHTLTFGDAISGEVLALQRCFRELGYTSEIYAINVDPHYKGKALDYRKLALSFPGQIILHYSLGSPLNDFYLSLTKSKRSLIYHNLTPAKWFKAVNPRVVKDIEHGLEELPKLCQASDKLIADSKFNASELKALGFNAQVLELPVDPEKWGVETNPGIYSLVKSEQKLHLLHVGRIAPNKCIEDIIKTVHYLHSYLKIPCRLWIVGHDIDTELYSFSLKQLVNILDLNEVVNFVGRMADSEVKALYQASTAYICMSEHEGFCCPVAEAMHFGLPVLAYASSALPETVGDGGILFSEKRYAELAELLKIIYEDSQFRNKLVQAGKNRVAQLGFENFKSNLKALFINQELSAQSVAAR